MEKTCTKCRKLKTLDQFYKGARHKFGVYSICKNCCKKRGRERYEDNPSHFKEIQKRYIENNPKARMRALLKNRFDITTEQYDAMFNEQGGKCAICPRKPTRRRLCVDHDHKTGKIRGLLCQQCNHAIGLFYDDVSIIERAIGYLNADN